MDRQRLRMRVIASTRARPNAGLERGQRDDQGIDQDVKLEAHEGSQADEEGSPTSESDLSTSSKGDSSDASSSSGSTSSGHVSCIREAQLSADGSCIFTSDHNRTFSVYSSNPSDGKLTPYASFKAHGPVRAFAPYPGFDINDSETTSVLVSVKDSYITLHNAIWDFSRLFTANDDDDEPPPPSIPVDISTKLASYKLINHLQEKVIAPLCLTYNTQGTHFIAGSLNQISTFNVEYTDNPVHKIFSAPRKRSSGRGPGFKGYVSSLDISSNGILAAGTWARHISIFDQEGLGNEITHFPIPSMVNDRPGLVGDGVSQLKWSPCGTYLYIAERSSDSILIYDSRNFGLALGYCVGRMAMTKQKLGFDIWSAGDQDPYAAYGGSDASHEVWAGGTDGKIRVWRDAHLKEGPLDADEVLEVGDTPVVSTIVYPNGKAVAPASGRWGVDKEDTQRRNWGSLDILQLEVEI
ncbi:WD40-repeat-containing domain protein [Lophiotrema nucula]|uniref:WD40-repeat-containing domain protein n=1 Tax=Lophiotrema nucula TaxID=690887 RepID=A0A6A5ZP71_9PLEO|nr:WD40-repeat-containing domain protein [Lophiotrema nucula]